MDTAIDAAIPKINFKRYFIQPAAVTALISLGALMPMLIHFIWPASDLNLSIQYGPLFILFPLTFPWAAILLFLASLFADSADSTAWFIVFFTPIFTGLSWGSIRYLIRYKRPVGYGLLAIYLISSIVGGAFAWMTMLHSY